MNCQIRGCARLVYARDLCRAHYMHWYRYGDPMLGRRVKRRSPIAVRRRNLAMILKG